MPRLQVVVGTAPDVSGIDIATSRDQSRWGRQDRVIATASDHPPRGKVTGNVSVTSAGLRAVSAQ
jgi:hypothetical protein